VSEGSRGRGDPLDRLRRGEVLIGDGALGTQLIARGLAPGEAPESWNLTRPEVLEEIARLYVEAGSEFVSTNSFGGSPIKLAACGLGERMEEINRAAVAAVRRAVGRRALVLGSCGPCGRLLTPYGDEDPAEVRAGFVAQMRVLVDAGVDLLGIETMTDLREAVLAVEAAREATGGSIPIAVTMTFERTRRGFFTIMGNDIPTSAATLAAAGADIIGSNCGKGIDEMIAVARGFRAATDMPLLFQPNAGLPKVEGGRLLYRETPEVFAARARDLVAAGASILGGCCGTTPEHIRLARQAVRE
jgi:5-methyltetrahydrofolate--homocysteine methyltransferase